MALDLSLLTMINCSVSATINAPHLIGCLLLGFNMLLPRACLGIAVFCLLSIQALGQGETTSAIQGEATDSTGAVVSGATVTITSLDTGSKRSVRTDEAGRYNFPQLKPGAYKVEIEAHGFEAQTANNVFAGLGQKQTVNFTLKVAHSNQTVEVSSEAPIINPSNANTSTTLASPALEDLPNPGGDLTYPLQFAPGALINTAGSGNDFVGGTNGYGNVEFNGLPALSNGYIVDGLETNDPLTNLNSGLSTNLVLGVNSISEVTVNTLSYSVDQGRYGASQVNYVTKSGSNKFHGDLYELWNGSILNAADYFTNATPGNHKPRSNVNHFGGSLGGPIVHDKLFFFFDSEWVRLALPIVTPATVPTSAFQSYVLQQLPRGGTDPITGSRYAPSPQQVPFYQKMFSLYGDTSGLPLAVLGCPFNSDGSPASGAIADGNGCANRQSVSHSSDDHEQVRLPESTTTSTRTTPRGSGFRLTPDCKPHGLTPSIHYSTQFPHSLSIPSRRATRTSSRRILSTTSIQHFRGIPACLPPPTLKRLSQPFQSCYKAAEQMPRSRQSEVSITLGFKDGELRGSSSTTIWLGAGGRTRSGLARTLECSA